MEKTLTKEQKRERIAYAFQHGKGMQYDPKRKKERWFDFTVLAIILFIAVGAIYRVSAFKNLESKYAEKIQQINHTKELLNTQQKELAVIRIDLAKFKIKKTDSTKEIRRLADVIETQEAFLKNQVQK